MQKRTFATYCLLATALVAGCKSTKNDPVPSRSELIAGTAATGKAWRVTSATATITIAGVAAPIDVITSPLSPLQACTRDDLVTMLPAGTFTITEGATSCTPPTPVINGRYALSADGNTLTLTPSGATGGIATYLAGVPITIVSLSSTKLEGKLTLPSVTVAGFAYTSVPVTLTLTSP